MRFVGLLLLLLVSLATASTPLPVSASTGSYRVFAYESFEGVTPLGVFGGYVVGWRYTGEGVELVAVDVYTGGVVALGLAGGLGVNPETAVLGRGGGHLTLFDGRAVVVWDSRLRMVGRFAHPDLEAVTVHPSGRLVAWTSDLAVVLTGPGYSYARLVDVWGEVYRLLATGGLPARRLLELAGYSPDRVEAEVVEELLSAVEEAGGTVVEGPHVTVDYMFNTSDIRVLRSLLVVDVVAAGLANSTLYTAVNVEAPVLVEGEVVYEVEGETRRHSVSRVYTPAVGLLLRHPANTTAVIVGVYGGVEAVASPVHTALAFAYEPAPGAPGKPRMLTVLLEDGSNSTMPLYTRAVVEAVYPVADFVLVEAGDGVLYVYRGAALAYSLPARRVYDVGVDGEGRVYIVYGNEAHVLELGFIDVYSGRCERYTVETAVELVGVHVDGDLLFTVGSVAGGTVVEVAAREPLATLLVRFTDPYGNPVATVLEGVAVVHYRGLTVKVEFNSNPLALTVPAGSDVAVVVYVPYGRGEYTFHVGEPGPHEYEVVVDVALAPSGRGYTPASKPFYNPFSRGYVLVRDTEILKYRLPGAVSMDAYGPLLALVEAPGANTTQPYTTVALYRVDGVRVYSVTLPGALREVRFYHPYLAVAGDSVLYILEALTGAVVGHLSLKGMTGYDVDPVHGYAVAWGRREIAVLDLRRGVTTYLDMGGYGAVEAAPTLAGLVYVYTSTGNRSRVYIVDPVSKSIVETLPWDGVKVVSFASDGVFHAVSFLTVDGRVATDILSPENGVVRVWDGPVVWVRTLGRVANTPLELRGGPYAAVAVWEPATARVYLVAADAVKAYEVAGLASGVVRFSLNYIAELSTAPGAPSAIVLRDYSGTPRVTIVTSIQPSLLAVSEALVAYGDSEETHLIPNPRMLGRYRIVVRVYDDRGVPVTATLHLREFGVEVEAPGGLFETYLSTPGVYHITVRAEHFRERTVEVEVSDREPSVEVEVRLEPELYRLAVVVATPDGRLVRDGTVRVEGVDVDYSSLVDLSRGEPVFTVRRGTYRVVFSSDVYTGAEATVTVNRDVEVELTTNRTRVRVTVKVVDEAGHPVAGATVTLVCPVLASPVKLRTGGSGLAGTTLPYGVVCNATARHPDYEPATVEFNATEAVEEEPLELTLRKPRIPVTVTVCDEEGAPEEATVTVSDTAGNVVAVVHVAHVATVVLEPGTYTFEGVTVDGRVASTTATIAPGAPATVNLVFPVKPTPLHTLIFPYLLAVAVAASAAVIVYRRFVRKARPRRVG